MTINREDRLIHPVTWDIREALESQQQNLEMYVQTGDTFFLTLFLLSSKESQQAMNLDVVPMLDDFAIDHSPLFRIQVRDSALDAFSEMLGRFFCLGE